MNDIKRRIVNELHKPARINFPRRKIVQKGIRNLYSTDLIDMQQYADENSNYKWILVLIDTFTKKAYAEKLKNKSAQEVCTALEKILNKAGNSVLLTSDRGKEYLNKTVQDMLERRNIRHYTSFNQHHAAHAEILIRNIKGKLFKEFNVQGNYKWLDILPQIMKKYNNTKHSTTKLRPNEVNSKNERALLRTVYNFNARNKTLPRFEENDYVRVSKIRQAFHKSYKGNWSTEIFRIRKVQNTVPTTYLLESMEGEPILGAFYSQELQITKYPNHYLVEKILRKKKDQYFVKWLNFPDKYNSYINKEDMI